MAIHVHTLGGLKIVRDGVESEALPGQPLRCALLLHVAVEGRASRESVMGVLWPDRDPERARHSLSQTLYELRRELGEDCIETAGEALRTGPDVRVDVVTFQEAAESGETVRALEVYGGHFLEGAHLAPTREFESWMDRVRSRLHRLHRKTRSEHIAGCLEAGRRAEALGSARRWVELDPLEDEAQQHLIRLLAETGRRSEALRQYERYRTLLARELELEPLEQIEAMVERIREGAAGPGAGSFEDRADRRPDGDRGRPEAGEARSAAPREDPIRTAVQPTSRSEVRADAGPEPGDRADGREGGKDLRELARRARLPRIVAFYLVASFAILQAVDILIDRIRVPETFFAAALVLLLAGLPIVVTTALIQSGVLQEFGGSWSGLPRRLLRVGPRWFTWRNAAIAGFAGAAVWTAYVFLFSPGEPVAPEAQVIAVLPFTVSGAGVEDFGEGIVSLLGPNLDGVGGIRTVNARTVIHRWDARGGDPDFPGALAIGREVGAGSVVLGSVVSLGDRVRLLAELHSVEGERLARADAEGSLSDVLSLVDSLTVDLVRNVWRSQEPIPDLRVSAVTTNSLPAMRAFFRGEELYRRSRWDSATVALRRAVELDSTFALAQSRLAEAEFWARSGFSPEALEAMDAAYRHRGRLPARERTLVVARRLDLRGDLAAVDTMEAFVRRYPEDAEGWFYLGDVRFHARQMLPLSSERFYRPFERAVELLPTFSPALIHPLQWSMIRSDSARFHRYLERFRSGSGTDGVEPYATWGRILWGPPDSVGVYMDRTLRELSSREWRPLMVALLHDPDLDPDLFLEVLAGRIAEPGLEEGERLALEETRASVLAGLGRLASFQERVEEVRAADPEVAARLELRAVLAGVADSEVAASAIQQLEDEDAGPSSKLWRSLLDLVEGRPEAARVHLRAGGTGSDAVTPSLLTAASGWARIAAGDTVAGLEELERGLRQTGYWWEDFQTHLLGQTWVRTLAARESTRSDGIRLLRNLTAPPELIVPTRLTLARALSASGRTVEARETFRHALQLWQGADPGLLSRLQEAREDSTNPPVE